MALTEQPDERSADDFESPALEGPRSTDPRNEVGKRVIEALRADAATSAIADGLRVEAKGGAVTIAGEIDDLDDEDAVLDVAERVDGVVGAVSRLRLRGQPEA